MKSIVFSSNTPEASKLVCKRALGISNEGGFGKYLGLPEHFGRRKKDIFSSILGRLSTKIESWSSKCLSSAGKLVLLRAILTAIPNYTMSCFKLPLSLCKSIQSLLTRFFWDDNKRKKKMVWVSWRRMALPKPLGGLGFRDISKFNDALLAKIGWRIISNPEALLARVMLGKYCVSNNFLTCGISCNASHGWRSILAGRDVIARKLIYSIGNGENTRIWEDHWIEGIPLHRPHGPRPLSLEDSKVKDLMTADGKDWNEVLIRRLFPDLVEEIMSIKFSKEGAKDAIHWLGTNDGLYSTRSGYYALLEDDATRAQSDRTLEWCSKIWKLTCAPKLRVFLWRICNQALPIGEALYVRGIVEHPKCVRCEQDETLHHVFFDCPFVQDVWTRVQWKIPFSPSHNSIEEDILRVCELTALPPYGVGSGPLGPWLLWAIWKARNYLTFQKRVYSQMEILVKAIIEAKEWQTSQKIHPTVLPGVLREALVRDKGGLVRINTDAAWHKESKIAGLGMVCTYQNRTSITQGCVHRFVSSPLVGEALAILEALKWAFFQNIPRLQIISDSKSCVDAINTNSGPREIFGILFDIHSLFSRFQDLSFIFTRRHLNVNADAVAKHYLCEHLLSMDECMNS